MPVLNLSFSFKQLSLASIFLLPASGYGLQLLNDNGQYQLAANKVTVVNVFEPDCSWCHKQFLALQHIYQHCSDHINILSTGVNGSSLALRKTIRAATITYPVVIADKALKAKIGKIEATPTNIFFDEQDNVVAKLRGYISAEKLSMIFQDSCPKLLP